MQQPIKMKGFFFQTILLTILSATFALPNSWRLNGDDDDTTWRDGASLTFVREKKSDYLGNTDDPNNWRNQRSLDFSKREFDMNKIPFYSYFEKKKKDKKEKEDEKKNKINSWNDGDDGVISCPPDYPKCIPRLGR